MNKLAKMFTALAVGATMACGIAGMAACSDGETHTHTPGTDWASYGNKHYHVCTEDGCNALVGDGEAHAAATGAEWKFDATQHWKACDECGAVIEVCQHTLTTDKCTSDYIHEGEMGKECSCGYFEASDTLNSYRTPVYAKQGTEKFTASSVTSTIEDTSVGDTFDTAKLTSVGLGGMVANTLDLDLINNKAKLKTVMETSGMKFTMIAATKDDCTEAMDAAMFMGLLIGEGTVAEATGGYTVTFNVPAHQADDDENPGQKKDVAASVIVFNVTKTDANLNATVSTDGTTTNTDLIGYFLTADYTAYEPLTGTAKSLKTASVELELTWNVGVTGYIPDPFELTYGHVAPTFGELNKITSTKLTVKVDGEEDCVIENLEFDAGTFAFNPVNPLIQTVTYVGENTAKDKVTVVLSEDGTVIVTVNACSALTGSAVLAVVTTPAA